MKSTLRWYNLLRSGTEASRFFGRKGGFKKGVKLKGSGGGIRLRA